MADNSVFISGAASGAFTDALSDLPPWATEDTATQIQGILQKTLNLQTKAFSDLVKKAASGSNTPEQQKKYNEELDKSIRQLKKENDEAPKQKKRWKDEDDQHNKDKKYWRDESGIRLKNFAIGTLLFDVATKIEGVFKDNFDVYTKLNAAGVDLITGFDKANTGFDSLAQLTTLTGVRYTELQATMLKFNTAVNAFTASKFAKTVGMARAELTKFGYSSKESAELLGAYLESQRGFTDNRNKSEEEVSKDLVKFGQRITNASLATGQMREKILENLDALSHSVKAQVLSGQVGEAQSEKVLEFIASFKDQKLGQEILAMMSDPIKSINETFTHLQKAGDGAFGQMEMNFIQSLKASGASADEQQEALAGFVRANRAGIQQMIQHNALLAQAGNQEAALANEHLNSLLQQERNFHKVNAAERARIEATNKARADFSSAWERFLSTFQRIFVPLIPMLNALTKGLEKLGDFITWTVEKLGSLDIAITSVLKRFHLVSDETEKINLPSILGSIAVGFLGLAGILKMFGFSLKGIIKGMFGFGTGKGGGAGGKGIGGIGGGKEGPGFLEKLGKGIGEIGKGIGAGVGGLLKGFLTGLADGLKAMGDSKVLKGTLALAGVAGALWITGKAVQQFVGLQWADLAKAGAALVGLVVVGYTLSKASSQMIIGAVGLAALGGSLWVIGKALQQFLTISWTDLGKAGAALVGLGLAGAAAGAVAPLILVGAAAFAAMGGALWVIGKAMKEAGPGLILTAQGIQEFGKIDGKNLLSVAGGIAALSGALIAFAAGSLVGGVGNVFTTLTGGFSKLFGDGSLLDQLKAFAAIGPGLSQTVSGISALTGSISILSASLSSLSGIDKLKDIVATVNSINLLKAAAFAVIGGSSVSLPKPTTTKGVSTPTSPKASTLNSPSQVSTKTPIESEQATSKEPTKPLGAGIEKPVPDSGINTMIGYQNSLLEQLLQSTNSLVSVNKDILKYTRVNT